MLSSTKAFLKSKSLLSLNNLFFYLLVFYLTVDIAALSKINVVHSFSNLYVVLYLPFYSLMSNTKKSDYA